MTEDGKQATVGKRRCMIYRLGYESFLQQFIFSVYIVPDMSLFGQMTMTVDLHETLSTVYVHNKNKTYPKNWMTFNTSV